MNINAHTKIGELIKHNPAALDAIVSLSTRFHKLRNPVLRKLMANRTSIETAARMGGITVDDFFKSLVPLGFKPGSAAVEKKSAQLPAFLLTIQQENVHDLDVRPLLSEGNDPLKQILKVISTIEAGHVLKLINSFEPVPLINLLQSKGFEAYAEHIDEELVNTYFYRRLSENNSVAIEGDPLEQQGVDEFDVLVQKFKGGMQSIDVRHLEMPLPMTNILESLDRLSASEALYASKYDP